MVKSYEIRNKTWQNGEDVYNWWLHSDSIPKQVEGQIEMDLGEEE